MASVCAHADLCHGCHGVLVGTTPVGCRDHPRSVVGVGVGLLAQATTRADLRSWSTLPKQIRFCKLPTPKDKKLTIQGVGTSFVEEISLKPAQTNFVILRSISSHVRPFVVNQISFNP